MPDNNDIKDLENKLLSAVDNIDEYKYMDANGLKTFAAEFFKKVDQMLDGRIVTVIDENSTDDQIPSANAIINLLGNEEEESV